MPRPDVSIVIPTRDAMAFLPALFEAFARQACKYSFEVVAIDSGSTDETVRFLRHKADRLLIVASEDFGHGKTRNLGIEAARGESIVLLVQDALPADEHWLQALVEPLFGDPASAIGATYARQLARPGASWATRRQVLAGATAAIEPRVQGLRSGETLADLSPLERFSLCTIDNVCSGLRKSVWKEVPIPEVAIAEDLAWGREVIARGLRIRFTPEARVFHSHERSVVYEFRRTFATHNALNQLFGLKTIDSVGALALSVVASASVGLRESDDVTSGALRITALARTLGLSLAHPVGQYCAASPWLRRLAGLVGKGI